MTIYSATITLILVMDPLGNIPVFLSILNTVEESKRVAILLREALIAFVVLVLFLLCGQLIMKGLNVSEPALEVAGGIVLFLISLKMVFPTHEESVRERTVGEPFIVPLAIPLLAGPSALATVLLFATQEPDKLTYWFVAIALASAVSTIILLFANSLRRVLGQKGLVAIERLMGMILITVSVQMFLTGFNSYLLR